MATDSLFINAPIHPTVLAGETIYAEGDVGADMFGIVSGSVELIKGAVVVSTLGPDDVFGERALIDRLPRNLSAVATSETVLAEIDRGLSSFWCTNRRRSRWASWAPWPAGSATTTSCLAVPPAGRPPLSHGRRGSLRAPEGGLRSPKG